MPRNELKGLAKRFLPASAQRRLRTTRRGSRPPVGFVRFGSFRRLMPISSTWGEERGTPIDRYYIDDFLRRHAGVSGYMQGDVRGHVLEVGDDIYARRFGGWGGSVSPGSAITVLDVLHADESNAAATIVGDLVDGRNLPANTFDCVICTQTLLLLYDVRRAIETLHDILKPGGVVLATFPGISKICRPDVDIWGDYWRFTSLSARRLFSDVFPPDNVRIDAYGNVLAAVASLHGLAAEELDRAELDLRDRDYEVLIAVRAQKRA